LNENQISLNDHKVSIFIFQTQYKIILPEYTCDGTVGPQYMLQKIDGSWDISTRSFRSNIADVSQTHHDHPVFFHSADTPKYHK